MSSSQALEPAAEVFPALRLVRSSQWVHRLAQALWVLLATSVAGMALLPWQQSVKGNGKVVAFVPQERQQSVESPVKGVIARIADGVVEGSRVRKGQFIVEIMPQAADLEQQLRAQRTDLQAKLATAEAKAAAYAENVTAYEEARDFGIQAAEEMIDATEAKRQAKLDLVPGYESKEWQAKTNYDRQRRLSEQGIKATQDVEKYRKEWDVAKAELASAQREVHALDEEVVAKTHELEQKRREADAKVDAAEAVRQDALGQAAEVRKDIRALEIKLSALDRLDIAAPKDGLIYRMPISESGQTVKEGDSLFTIVPDSSQLAVELWVSGNDLPLVHENDVVRIQFEGWPAIQFAGWPSVAVGTFGGRVMAIDATDDGKGRFRVLVGPDSIEEWPSNRYLRQGVRTNGWVLLRRVRLGYEIWRQLNGFPPVISEKEPDAKGDSTKMPKLPK